jgi:hypothetical protein
MLNQIENILGVWHDKVENSKNIELNLLVRFIYCFLMNNQV